MIHGYLFITDPRACLAEQGHGIEFRTMMDIINSMTGLNLTIYHNFHDEVE